MTLTPRYREVSPAGLAAIRDHEALRLRTYDDATGQPMQPGQVARGTPTIGRGNTRHALPVRDISVEEAETFFREDVRAAAATIYRHVPLEIIDGMPQACWDALVSFVFNVGAQAFINNGKRTDFWRALVQNPDRAEVARQMQRWVKSRGVVMPGLVKRRGAEAALWGAGLLANKSAAITADDVLAREARVEPEPPREAPSFLTRPETAVGATAGVTAIGATLQGTGQSLMLGDDFFKLAGLLLVLAGCIVTIVLIRRQR